MFQHDLMTLITFSSDHVVVIKFVFFSNTDKVNTDLDWHGASKGENNVEPHVLHKLGFLQFLLFARKLSQFHFGDCLKESNHYKYISSPGLCRCLPVHGCVILWVIV